MSIFRFIIRSFFYYRKQHFALFAASLLSTAVLTGALVVGDSVKFSLKQIVKKRLGKTEFALAANERFFESRLANDIAGKSSAVAAPILSLRGIAINNQTNARINAVQVLGIDEAFGKFSENPFPGIHSNEAVISGNTASKLNLKTGDTFLLRVEKANLIPLNAPFVADENSAVAMMLKVKAISSDDQPGRFSLNSNQAQPFNIFLNLDFLAKKLGLEGRANLLIIAGNEDNLSIQQLNNTLAQCWLLPDAGLKIRELNSEGKYEILSDRIFIDKPISDAIINLDLPKETVLTYLVNSIHYGSKSTPYSFVTALSGNTAQENISNNQIIVNEWLADDLKIKPGDSLTLDYFVIGPMRRLEEKSRSFVVKTIIPTQGDLTEKTLMPMFPGISEAANCSDWETGIPIDLKKIRAKDEDYWNRFKGTPKAIVSLEAGQEMWENQFGNLTAIRFSKSDISVEELQQKIIGSLDPAMIGLAFRPVLQEGMLAAENSVDFGGLFLSLSFFVIAAGILLTVLIYSLNTETRSRETGVLSAVGVSNSRMMMLKFFESALPATIGGIAGVGAGILYNLALLAGLNSVWQGAVHTTMLELHIEPFTLFISAIAGIILSLLSVFVVTFKKLRKPLANLIRKTPDNFFKTSAGRFRWNMIIALTGIMGSLVMVAFSFVFNQHENPGLFLAAGALFMLGCFAMITVLMNTRAPNRFVKNPGIFLLALRYTGRNKNRSLAAIVLLSIGAFSIIITAANRKTFYGTENLPQSGTGGYQYWVQTTIPVLFDLNTEEGRVKANLGNEPLLNDVKFIQMHTFEGDDASCLNLNGVLHPTILGVDVSEFQKRNAFSFAKTQKGIEKNQAWRTLEQPLAPGVIPAIADQTVITWGLKRSVGDTLFYTDEAGKPLKLVLIAGLENSVFQGNLLIADSLFMVYFPSVSGSKIMLLQAPDSIKPELAGLLNSNFIDYGIELTAASTRLAEFNTVENTYLTVFMILGGLGVLIGTLGLAIVLFRNILERKEELALMLALGYRKSDLFNIIFIENIFILLAGLLIGILGAVVGILPSLVSPAFNFSPTLPFMMILIILLSGMAAIYFPANSILNKNLIEHLKSE